MNIAPLELQPCVVRPVPALRRGDAVGIAAPASPVQRDGFDAALDTLKRLGLRPRFRTDIFDRHLYWARSDAVRAAELTELFLDPAIKAIFCACPGYGSLRLLPLLPWDEIRQHPKIIMGYSDLTALILAVHGRCGFATFHGPTLVRGFLPEQWTREAATVLRRTLFRAAAPCRFRLPAAQVLRAGEATGPLIGGNLEMLTSLIGTPWAPVTRDAILFIEEVDEGEETLDHHLTHLRLSGLLEGVRGILFGDMGGNTLSPPYKVEDVIRHALGDLDLPILMGFPAGHGVRNLPLAIGARYSLSTRTRTIVQLDSGVVPP